MTTDLNTYAGEFYLIRISLTLLITFFSSLLSIAVDCDGDFHISLSVLVGGGLRPGRNIIDQTPFQFK